MAPLLIIDDEKDICLSLAGLLEDEGYDVQSAQSLEEAWPFILKNPPELILLDVWLGKGVWDGLEALDRLKSTYPLIPVIMMSGHSTVSMALHAIKKGAQDFLEKPLDSKKLLDTLGRYLQTPPENIVKFHDMHHGEQRVKFPEHQGNKNKKHYWPENFLKDHQWKTLCQQPLISLLGPQGSQLCLLAQEIHQRGPRNHKALGVLDGRYLHNMDPKEWFGFFPKIPGVSKVRHAGWLEHFHGGTVVVHHGHCLTAQWQRYWLEFLEKPQHTPLGGQLPISFDIHFIFCASHDLSPLRESLDQKHHGQEDSHEDFSLKNKNILTGFYYKLLSQALVVKPLETKDIEDWLKFFLKNFFSPLEDYSFDKKTHYDPGFCFQKCTTSLEFLDLLRQHSWPGDRQELYHTLALAVQHWARRGSLGPLLPQDLPFQHSLSPWMSDILEEPLKRARALFEWHYMNHHYGRIQGNTTQVAKMIGMNRAALHRKMRLLEESLGLKESSKDVLK